MWFPHTAECSEDFHWTVVHGIALTDMHMQTSLLTHVLLLFFLPPSLLPLPPPPSSTGESAMGPVVKQIMDHPRCAQLREGDVILEVNGEKVNNYVHTDLVTVLKRCGKGNQANFTVLRQPAEVHKTQ